MHIPKPLSTWIERTTVRRSIGKHWPTTLDRSRVFILPSRFGLLAAGAVIAMLLVALNYQNSPAFLLAFLLGALLWVAMVACHQHLRGLVVTSLCVEPVFAGEPIALAIGIENRSRRARAGLVCYVDKATGHPVSVAPGGEAVAQLALVPQRRGRHTIDHCGLASSEPLGVFRAWSRLAPVACIVYPRPAVNAPPPPGATGLATRDRANQQPEDFQGLARYRVGDRPSQIAWPAYARGGTLERKAFGGTGGGARWLRFAETPGTDVEMRLSVLTAWALEAERGAASWGLRLPGHTLAPARGHAHLARALRAMALYPGPYDR
jgi:uncharacterized protein (DUF58 family)